MSNANRCLFFSSSYVNDFQLHWEKSIKNPEYYNQFIYLKKHQNQINTLVFVSNYLDKYVDFIEFILMSV